MRPRTLGDYLALGFIALILILCIGNQATRWPETRARQLHTEAKAAFTRLAPTLAKSPPPTNTEPDGNTFLPDAANLEPDPFSREKNSLRWYRHGTGGLLLSIGPDRALSIRPTDLATTGTEPLARTLINVTYDPTNGSFSIGDVWSEVKGDPPQ